MAPPPPPPTSGAANRFELSPSSLPDDVTINIASFLEVPDLCSLGSCSRYLRAICANDFLWIVHCKRRWPALALELLKSPEEQEGDVKGGESAESSAQTNPSCPPAAKGWKNFYILRHNELSGRVSSVVDYVKQCSQNESLEVGDYLKAVENLVSIGLAFEDVKLFLFTAKHNVLLNLIGLHYAMFCLGISGSIVNEALCSCKISDRQVCILSLRLGRWFFGFRLPDERSSRKLSLSELTTSGASDLRSILNRGAVHEVLRVQIMSAAAATAAASAS